MTAAIETRARGRPLRFRLPLALRLALSDLRGGFSGFTIFLICIALGTGAIGAINSLSDAIQDALAREGTVLLGGDVEATLVHRQASPEEVAYLRSFGPRALRKKGPVSESDFEKSFRELEQRWNELEKGLEKNEPPEKAK